MIRGDGFDRRLAVGQREALTRGVCPGGGDCFGRRIDSQHIESSAGQRLGCNACAAAHVQKLDPGEAGEGLARPGRRSTPPEGPFMRCRARIGPRRSHH